MKKFVIIGLGHRSGMYTNAITKDFNKTAEEIHESHRFQSLMNIKNTRHMGLGDRDHIAA